MSAPSARLVVLALCGLAAAALRPVPVEMTASGSLALNLIAGLVAGGLVLAAESRWRRLPARVLLGSAAGLLLGAAIARVLVATLPVAPFTGLPAGTPGAAAAVLQIASALGGALLGARKAQELRVDRLVSWLHAAEPRQDRKILDTSVIIDGRIADICETGFLEGVLVVPRFVLAELQYIADSSDPMRKNRGRRGLDTLQRIKKRADARVEFSEEDFPQVREVDLKLIELALRERAKIVTNDFNLNKVAQLRGVEVLNINDLANSVKPVVLPGETMHVFILKEGKEPNQGVAYLDDGTMVVVDNARKLIGQNAEITITSVLQTAAGKMFFGTRRNAADRAARAGREAGTARAEGAGDAG